MSNGIAIAQSSVPIETAADYKKVYDSRGKFLEVAYYGSVDFTFPYIAAGGTNVNAFSQEFLMFPHSLGFFPLFEYSISLISGTLASPDQSYQDIRATKDGLYMYPYFNYNYGQSAVTVRLNYRIYNLDIEKTYDSKSATFASASTGGSSIGAKFLDGSTSNAVQDDSTLGFSLDTSKKTIAVHMITQQSLNSYGFSYVYHNSGYPPSYLMCDLPEQKFKEYFAGYNIPYRDRYTSSAIYNLTAYTIANGDYIAFHGVQSVVRGDFCFVILKDPLDIAE